MVAAQNATLQFDILLTEGFVLSEYAAVVDSLRVANRILPQARFSWRALSKNGGSISSTALAEVASQPFDAKPDADYAIVLGNSNPDCPQLSLRAVLSTYLTRGAKVALLSEAASRHIRDSNTEGAGFTTHWENLEVLNEQRCELDPERMLAVEDGALITCAGMGATVDLMLELIGRHCSAMARQRIADILLHESIRDFGSRQPMGERRSRVTGDKTIDGCIRLMKAHIEAPLSVRQLAARLGVAERSLERRFKATLNATPVSIYREIRLNRAINLLLNTTMTVREIGLACGYEASLTSNFKKIHGMTPKEMRKRRQPQAMGPAASGSAAKSDGFDGMAPSDPCQSRYGE